MWKGLLIFCYLAAYSISYGQSEHWKFDRISLSKGLSNTFVSGIIKDSKGYMWMATKNGLNRYNAYEIQTFNHDSDDPNTLSSDVVNCVFEDANGVIWAGTANGLNKYDRNTGFFKYYKPNEDKTTLGPPNTVRKIVQDHNGYLWLASSRQNAIRFNPTTETFDHPINVKEDSTYGIDHPVNVLLVDSDNNLWIGGNGSGIVRYNIETDERYSFHPITDKKHQSELAFCYSLHQDRLGNIWAGTFVGGLMKYIPEENRFRLYRNPYNADALIKNGALSLNETKEGNIIIGSNGGGIFIFDPKKEEFLKNYTYDAVNGSSLSDDFIIEIYEDNTGIFWFGSENGGVSYYNPNERKFKSFKKEGNSETDMPDNIINSIYVDPDGLIWIGTENGGYASFNRETGNYQSYQINNVQFVNNSTFVRVVTAGKDSTMWIGASMGGLNHVSSEGVVFEQYANSIQPGPNNLPDHDIRAICVDRDETIWVGSFNGFAEKVGEEFYHYCSTPINNRKCNEAVNSIFDYSDDWLIVTYFNDGIKFFNKKTKEFGSQFRAGEEKGMLSATWVNSVYKDSKNRVWMGTAKGLNLFNTKDSTFTSYQKKDGLPDNDVIGILEDHEGNLWISTACGLCNFNPEELSFKNYYEEDGLQSNVFKHGAYYKSKSGELFFGGVDGFNAFFPYDLLDNPYPPEIVFTDFQVFNESVIPGENSPIKNLIENCPTVELNYDQETFSFEFAALNYTVTEKNEYAYMLEGFEEEWNFIGKRRYISFTNIPPGEYTLRVKACNNDGLWNEEGVSLDLIIHPPFWQTWWFRISMFIFVVSMIYFIYKRRVRSIETQNKILEQQVMERTEEVVLQKNVIEKQKELVEEKNKDMIDSIRYSKRIQDSFLPEESDIRKHFENFFVLFKPKDIVSGDFYWSETIKGKVYLAVADCTGHGVPGAMVSVLGNNGLNRSIKEIGHTEAHTILDDLNAYVENSLERKEGTVRDGMDIALCVIDPQTGKMEYSGANNPVWIAREGEIIEIKADKQPIGNYDNRKPFTKHDFQLEKGDWVFLFSDGYPDQFGGPKGKKYKYATLKRSLLEFNDAYESNFEQYLDKKFLDWKGDIDQVDDVCILGIKF